jgi:tRNA-dihydrouridine synthase
MVAQIWGTDPEKFYQAAQLIVKLGFDGIDINMGCPQDKEIGIGACAALIRTPLLVKQIIEATKKGAGDLPVSVKTRLGYTSSDEMAGWIENLLSCDIATLTLHARTKQEKSKVPAHWEKIKEAVEIRDHLQRYVIARRSASEADEAISNKEKIASARQISSDTGLAMTKTLIIGNGDVKSRAEGLARIKETGCDGVMIGRGAFGNPWTFRSDDYQPSIKERLTVMLEHAQLFQEKLGEYKSFFIMRKHFKAYASVFDGAHELRAKLMEAKNLDETKTIVEEFLSTAS